MSEHTDLKDWCEHHEGQMYRTTKDLVWHIGYVGSTRTYVVPAGQHFDVSIPRFLWWLLDPHDHRFLKAACIHDHMLESGWDRPTSGGVFHAALEASGVSGRTRLFMFLAVTLWKWR